MVLPPERFVVTLNEGWRGEASHCLLTDASGKGQIALQGQGPLISQLERAGHVAAGYRDIRLPAEQQELQPVILRV
jgi:hypothetical protein